MAVEKTENKTWFNVSVIANILMLVVAFVQLEENRKANVQLARANADTREANARAAEQADASMKLQKVIAENEEHRAIQQRRLEIAPLLIVKRCCNQAPISILDRPQAGNGRIGLRRLEKVDPIQIRGDDDLTARSEKPYVVRIANVGSGVAIGTKAFWIVDKVVLTDGTARTVAEDQVNGHMKPYTWPATVQPGESAYLLHLPHFLSNDNDLQVINITGSLLLTCDDASNEKHEFRQPFSMDTVYHPDRPDALNGTRLSFHFYEPGADLESHFMAKPVLDASSNRTER